MKKLKFELDGQPLRVYLDRSGAVFVDVKDLYYGEDEKNFPEILADHPAAKTIAGRPVWEESVFYHVWLDEMAADELAMFYLTTVQPKIRQELMIMAESDWQESDKVRQLEQDLEMNLSERRKAEEHLTACLGAYDLLLTHFVRVCADNGVMSRLLLKISSKIKDREILARIAEVLKNDSALNPKDRKEAQG